MDMDKDMYVIMTKKEEKEFLIDLFNTRVSNMIGVGITKLIPLNRKLYKGMLSHGVAVAVYTLNYISTQYYNWEVHQNEYTPNKNMGRLVYLFNENIDICKLKLEKSKEYLDCVEKDYCINMKNGSEDLKPYYDIAEEVGL
ncbi:MAG: hypothetical protein ACRCZ0_12095 [Cetobacterium sp.]